MGKFGTGFMHFFKAFGFISRHRLWHYYAYPVVLSVLWFFLSTYAAFSLADYLADSLFSRLDIVKPPADESGWELLKSWLLKAAETGIAIVLKLGIWLLLLKMNKYLVLILLSPVFAFLSERVEQLLTGRSYPFSTAQLIKDALRGSALACRNFFIETSAIAVLMVMGWFIPLLALFSVPFLLVLSAYFYGFSMMDYTNERRRLSIPQSIAYIRANKGIALGNGFAYLLIDSIPLLGLVIAPVNAAVGATTAILEIENQSKNT